MKNQRWKNQLSKHGIWAGFLIAFAMGTPVFADSVLTLAGKTIEGTIVRETDDEVVLNTTDYGELSFRKVSLSAIRRSSGAAPAPGAANANPFSSGGGNTNPFNSTPSAPAASTSNPFNTGGGNPFNSQPPVGGNSFNTGGAATTPPPSRNPFAPNPPAAPNYGVQPNPQVPQAPEKKVYNPDSLPNPSPVSLPTVPIAWQGVLFNIENNEELRLTPKGNTRSSLENEADLYFTGPLSIRTDNTKVMGVLKNGTDSLRFNPRSQVKIKNSTAGLSEIELVSGAVWVNLDDSPDERELIVRTQVAEITANNKVEFRVADALEQGVHIAVISGEVKVNSTSAQIQRTLKAGEMFLVRPEGSMSDVVPADNLVRYEYKGWASLELDWFLSESRTEMGVGMLDPRDLVNRNDLTGLIRSVGQAFLAYTKDTNMVPTDSDGYSVLLENVHNAPGWNGPYLNGIVPPVDCWGRPLRYTTKNTDESGRPIGVVYSLGEDGRDNSGNPSADITEMVLFYQITDRS